MTTANDTIASSWNRPSNRSISPGLNVIDRSLYSADPFYAHNKFLKDTIGKDMANAG